MNKRATIDLYRCADCGRLRTDRHIPKQGPCKCGCWQLKGSGSLRNLWEYIQCWWWNLTME